jgi:hypothetical protein
VTTRSVPSLVADVGRRTALQPGKRKRGRRPRKGRPTQTSWKTTPGKWRKSEIGAGAPTKPMPRQNVKVSAQLQGSKSFLLDEPDLRPPLQLEAQLEFR